MGAASTTSARDQWSTQLPVSRGQWRTIAELAIELLDAERPETRYEAELIKTRLQLALAERAPRNPLPETEPF